MLDGPDDVQPADDGEYPAYDNLAPDQDGVNGEFVCLAPGGRDGPTDEPDDEAEGDGGDAVPRRRQYIKARVATKPERDEQGRTETHCKSC